MALSLLYQQYFEFHKNCIYFLIIILYLICILRAKTLLYFSKKLHLRQTKKSKANKIANTYFKKGFFFPSRKYFSHDFKYLIL